MSSSMPRHRQHHRRSRAGASTRPRVGGKARWKHYCSELSALADGWRTKASPSRFITTWAPPSKAPTTSTADGRHRDSVGLLPRYRPSYIRRRRSGEGGEETHRAHQSRSLQGYTPLYARSLPPARCQFLDAVVSGIFTVPGDGIVDYPKVFSDLGQGWIFGLDRPGSRAGSLCAAIARSSPSLATPICVSFAPLTA